MNLRAAGMRGFVPVMASLGVDAHPFLDAVGIPRSAIDDENERISLQSYADMIESAARSTQCDDLGLRLADAQDITILGPLAIAMQNASTLGEALVLCSQYLHTHSPGICLSLHESPPTADGAYPATTALRMSLILPSWRKKTQVMEQCLADLHNFIAMMAGGTDRICQNLLAVQLDHPQCTNTARYIQVFSRRPEFEADYTQLVVPSAFLNHSMKQVSEHLHRLSVDYLQLAFAPKEATTTERVEDILRRALSTTRGRREVVAKLLNMHPRTLQRRLGDEGVSYTDLVDRARREQTRHWLGASRLPLSQVAGAVGLADQSVLNRNCRRWFGCTPLQLRRGSDRKRGAVQR